MSARKTASKKRPASQSRKKSASASAPKAKSGTASRANPRKSRSAGDEEVTIDRRRSARGKSTDDKSEAPKGQVAPPLERRAKVNRRRQIDPTTCERDYSDAEVEFMNALDDYKRKSGRMFPTCSEVLEVVRSLGYVKHLSTNQSIACSVQPEAVDDSLAADSPVTIEATLPPLSSALPSALFS